MINITPRDITRFWKHVTKTEGCWECDLKGAKGYPNFQLKIADGLWLKSRANRVAYTIANGDIPEGLLVCHTCDNPKCVNPEHLFLGTPFDNVKDMFNKGRNPVSPFTDEKLRREMVERARTPKSRSKRIATFADIRHQQGVKNSQFGTCWVMLPYGESRRIPASSLSEYMQNGWVKGRKM